MTEIIDLVEEDPPDAGPCCETALLTLFPDICPVYLEKILSDHDRDPDRAVDFVLDLQKQGQTYEKVQKTNKRKRQSTPSENRSDMAALIAKYTDGIHRELPADLLYLDFAKKLISQEFPRVRVEDIRTLLMEKHGCLLPTCIALDEITRLWSEGDANSRFTKKKTSTPPESRYLPANIDATILRESNPVKQLVLEELRASRQVRAAFAAERGDEVQRLRNEEENFARAQKDGLIAECGCCYGEYALNRIVHCDGEGEHLFCVECSRRNAESAIGMTQFELNCMSTDGCTGGFSISQRKLFLDEKLTAALDRIEYEAVLRLSGIDNLERCPFCPFAAEYPPVEEDKEFRCGNEDCRVVSCRLCKEETHVPRSCQEAAKEKGVSARRQIEEAMSEAMIRKCNKCQTPFIKEHGCNKMTCTRQGCGNVQCYVCSKSCGYDHFNDPTRGGKVGNCPLFDSHEVRHEAEVSEAEQAARQRVAEENPDIDEELLRFDMSQGVADDDAQRRSNDPYAAGHIEGGQNVAGRNARVPIPGHGNRFVRQPAIPGRAADVPPVEPQRQRAADRQNAMVPPDQGLDIELPRFPGPLFGPRPDIAPQPRNRLHRLHEAARQRANELHTNFFPPGHRFRPGGLVGGQPPAHELHRDIFRNPPDQRQPYVPPGPLDPLLAPANPPLAPRMGEPHLRVDRPFPGLRLFPQPQHGNVFPPGPRQAGRRG